MNTTSHLPGADTWLARLEALTLRLEAPLYRWIRNAFFFLFYYTGTLAFWTLVLLGITGLYVTLFYRFSFTGSYQSIAGIDSNLVGHVIRGMHRYLADLMVLLALLHAWRMFVENRFKGPRWLAWVSGVVLIFVIWIIGVTGFWMLADTRAQWLHQILVKVLSTFRFGHSLILRFLLPWEENNGWLYMVALFFLHVGLSFALALIYWLHIRHLHRPRWFPHQAWMVSVVVLVALAALFVPVTRLPIWDFTRWPRQTPINVFYLFWVPEALYAGRLVLAFLGFILLAALIPWLWRPRIHTQPVRLDEDKCIGCTLCARDCPYQALEMVPRGGNGPRWIARLYPERCVGCGVCVGSCPTDALSLPSPEGDPQALRTRIRQALQQTPHARITFACHRHVRMYPELVAQAAASGNGTPPVQVIGVSCISALHPDMLTLAWKEGASELHVIGCPPEDCPDRFGSIWEAERLSRKRKPWLRIGRKRMPLRVDWVPPTEFPRLLHAPIEESTEDATPPGSDWHRWIRRPAFWKAVLMLAFLIALVVAGNQWVYAGPAWADQATLQIAIHHQPGRFLAPAKPVEASASAESGLYITLDGAPWYVRTFTQTDGPLFLFVQRWLPPGKHQIEATLVLGNEAWQLFHITQDWAPRRVYTYQFRDKVPGGDPERGKRLYFEEVPGKNTGCRLCHSLNPGERRVGPSLAGIATKAATRVPGMSAREYLYESIVHPDAYVVPGYPAGVMPPNYREILTEEDIQDLVAFLLTLK